MTHDHPTPTRRIRTDVESKRCPATQRRTRVGKPVERLTIAQLCQELQVSRSTFYDWRAKKRGPRCIRLPNGELRIRRTDLEVWLESCEEDVA